MSEVEIDAQKKPCHDENDKNACQQQHHTLCVRVNTVFTALDDFVMRSLHLNNE